MTISFNIPDSKVADFNTYFKRQVPKFDSEISDLDHYKMWVIGLTKDALINGQIKLAHDGVVIDNINIS